MDKSKNNYYDGQICEAYSIEHRFGREKAFEIKFVVGIFNPDRTPRDKVDVFLEVSMEYGKGNNAGKTQWDITKETLASLGFSGDDISNAQLTAQLVNKPCRICEKTHDNDGKPYTQPRYYFTTSRPVKQIDNANELLRSIMSGVAGGGFAAPAASVNPFNAPVAAAPAAASAPNPFM